MGDIDLAFQAGHAYPFVGVAHIETRAPRRDPPLAGAYHEVPGIGHGGDFGLPGTQNKAGNGVVPALQVDTGLGVQEDGGGLWQNHFALFAGGGPQVRRQRAGVGPEVQR